MQSVEIIIEASLRIGNVFFLAFKFFDGGLLQAGWRSPTELISAVFGRHESIFRLEVIYLVQNGSGLI
jgi:hypothetical protein